MKQRALPKKVAAVVRAAKGWKKAQDNYRVDGGCSACGYNNAGDEALLKALEHLSKKKGKKR